MEAFSAGGGAAVAAGGAAPESATGDAPSRSEEARSFILTGHSGSQTPETPNAKGCNTAHYDYGTKERYVVVLTFKYKINSIKR